MTMKNFLKGFIASSMLVASFNICSAKEALVEENETVGSLGAPSPLSTPTLSKKEALRKALITGAYRVISVAETIELFGGFYGIWRGSVVKHKSNVNNASGAYEFLKGFLYYGLPAISLLKVGTLAALYTQKEERHNEVFSRGRLIQSTLFTVCSVLPHFMIGTVKSENEKKRQEQEKKGNGAWNHLGDDD